MFSSVPAVLVCVQVAEANKTRLSFDSLSDDDAPVRFCHVDYHNRVVGEAERLTEVHVQPKQKFPRRAGVVVELFLIQDPAASVGQSFSFFSLVLSVSGILSFCPRLPPGLRASGSFHSSCLEIFPRAGSVAARSPAIHSRNSSSFLVAEAPSLSLSHHSYLLPLLAMKATRHQAEEGRTSRQSARR